MKKPKEVYTKSEKHFDPDADLLIQILRYLSLEVVPEKLTKKDLAAVERKLNNSPRKTLGFKSPNEVFWGRS